MKIIATLILSIAACGMAAAAPMTLQNNSNPILQSEETGGNRHGGEGVSRHIDPDPGTGPGDGGAVPEPASLALLGIGLGVAALKRRK
jgi:hypothetical protein